MLLAPMPEAGLSCLFNCVAVEVLVTNTTAAELGFLFYRMRGWLFLVVHGILIFHMGQG
jgi:hypothetical protein